MLGLGRASADLLASLLVGRSPNHHPQQTSQQGAWHLMHSIEGKPHWRWPGPPALPTLSLGCSLARQGKPSPRRREAEQVQVARYPIRKMSSRSELTAACSTWWRSPRTNCQLNVVTDTQFAMNRARRGGRTGAGQPVRRGSGDRMSHGSAGHGLWPIRACGHGGVRSTVNPGTSAICPSR